MTAVDTCDDIMKYFQLVSGDLFSYDARIFKYDYYPYVYWKDFLANATKANQIYSALHVNESTKVPIFVPHSNDVFAELRIGFMADYSKYYDYLIFNRFPTLLIAAEYDPRDGATGI